MLKIFNTLTRTKETFLPLEDNQVTFYQCGPTVYWTQHLGNMRAMLNADFTIRSLRYLGFHVKFVRNYTDVGHMSSDEDTGEDKLEKGAKREHLTPQEVANKYILGFEKDLSALNILPATYKPRATEHIKEVIAMVQTLLDKGYAYATPLAIYFDVSKAKDYSRLSKQDQEKKITNAGKGEVSDPNKKNPHDFALWFFKAGTHKEAMQFWPSPFVSPEVKNGEGFPGWHIECSVMSKKYLGETIDIHMGGIEHIPVHHTNEIAQSEAANGKKFVDYWIHNEHLLVDDAKMAKSTGTGFTLQEIIEKGYDPLAFRYFVLGAHYRSKLNFTWPALKSAQKALDNLYAFTAELGEPGGGCAEFEALFEEAISDDFNTPQALAIIWNMLKSNNSDAAKKGSLLKFDSILGFNLAEIKPVIIPGDIKKLAEQREILRQQKKWAEADELRKKITAQGFQIDDTPAGPVIKK